MSASRAQNFEAAFSEEGSPRFREEDPASLSPDGHGPAASDGPPDVSPTAAADALLGEGEAGF